MDKEMHSLKTGYLLKQGVNKKWKVRWFILQEDELKCFHKRDRSLLIEVISLQGCSVVCPCLEDSNVNNEDMFKIHTPEGEELYFQSAGRQDRESWAYAIGAVIRSLSTSKQVSQSKVPFQNFRVYANVSEIMGAVQDPDAGVELGSHVRSGTVHKNCFRGSDVVDWLLRWSIVHSRDDGGAMALTLLKLGHLQEVDLNDGSSGVSSKFNDGEKLYRFTCLNLGLKRNSYYDSTDSDSSSDDEEEEEDAEEINSDKMKKGKVVRQGFLLKKKNIRAGWRIVKVILRDGPPSLEYFKASSLENMQEQFPTKLLDLRDCSLLETPKGVSGSASASSATSGKHKKPKLWLRDKKGKRQTFQPKDEGERCEWWGLLSPLCPTKEDK